MENSLWGGDVMRRKLKHTIKCIMLTIIAINAIVILSSCSKINKVQETTISSSNINNSSHTSDNKEPTDGINPDWKVLKESLQLSDLLDFNWNDVTSITINKYQDNAKVASEIISDKQYISDIASITSELSVIHSYNNQPDDNTVYEIVINPINDVNKNKFISFGPILEDSEYGIGGSFVESNNLTRIQYLVQSNPEITFNNIQEILEQCIFDNSY